MEVTDRILGAGDRDRPMALANPVPDDTEVDQPGRLNAAIVASFVFLSSAGDVESTVDPIVGLA